MRILVKVKPNSKHEKIEKINNQEFVLWVRQPAKEGRANQAVIEFLSEYFGVAKRRIEIIRGHKNKNKIIDILI
jgi:hypothetical protein